MKICIPMKTLAEGGGNYVINNFRRYLDGQGIEHTQDVLDAFDVLFTNSWNQDYYLLLQGLKHNIDARVVHRANGVAHNYGRFDDADDRHRRIASLADAVIYQSQYAYDLQRKQYKIIKQDGPVIWNPVDLEQFTPAATKSELTGTIRIAYSKFSTNPFKGEAQLYQVAAANPDIDFYLCGRYDDPPEIPNLHLMGKLDRQQLAQTLRSCHMLLAFFRNESCSNTIIEGMSSGLPVLYLDSGSNQELVQDAGAATTVDNFRENVDRIMAQHVVHAQAARERAENLFSMDGQFGQYVQVIEQALSEPLYVSVSQRKRLIAAGQISHPIEKLWGKTGRFRRRVRGKLRLMFGGDTNRT